jgi:hypothetical protein
MDLFGEISKVVKAAIGAEQVLDLYDLKDVNVLYGVPTQLLKDVVSISVKYNEPRWVRATGVFGRKGRMVRNLDQSGKLVIGIPAASLDNAFIEAGEAIGQPLPMAIFDNNSLSLMSQVLATQCRRVEVPEWVRTEKMEQLNYHAFESPEISIIHGGQKIA